MAQPDIWEDVKMHDGTIGRAGYLFYNTGTDWYVVQDLKGVAIGRFSAQEIRSLNPEFPTIEHDRG
jgi:hypothetical protein